MSGHTKTSVRGCHQAVRLTDKSPYASLLNTSDINPEVSIAPSRVLAPDCAITTSATIHNQTSTASDVLARREISNEPMQLYG